MSSILTSPPLSFANSSNLVKNDLGNVPFAIAMSAFDKKLRIPLSFFLYSSSLAISSANLLSVMLSKAFDGSALK
jgi:hypothetical protein